MQWESTDQFGNLYVGQSDATDWVSIKPSIESLVQRILERHGSEKIEFAVDPSYGEVSAPRGDQVSHVLQLPWLAAQHDAGASVEVLVEKLSGMILGYSAALGVSDVGVRGPWES